MSLDDVTKPTTRNWADDYRFLARALAVVGAISLLVAVGSLITYSGDSVLGGPGTSAAEVFAHAAGYTLLAMALWTGCWLASRASAREAATR
jgi:hypothetical protein